MATDKPRFSLTLDEETMARVLAYQEKHGLSTKSRAIQALVASGLEDYKEKSPGPAEPGEDVKEFISMVSQLTDEHKRFLLVVIQALIELEQGQPGGSPGKAGRTK